MATTLPVTIFSSDAQLLEVKPRLFLIKSLLLHDCIKQFSPSASMVNEMRSAHMKDLHDELLYQEDLGL